MKKKYAGSFDAIGLESDWLYLKTKTKISSAPRKYADQTGHPTSLNSATAVHV